jgi:hypothetical protein
MATAKKKKAPAKKSAAKRRPAAKKAAPKASRTLSPVDRLRKICLSLPQTTEVESWGAPTFRVGGKIFAMYADSGNHHHEDGRPGVWMLSIGIEQDFVIRARPERYFKPPYVGPSGWIGAYLDKNPPWGEIEELLRDAWRRRAPRKVADLLED